MLLQPATNVMFVATNVMFVATVVQCCIDVVMIVRMSISVSNDVIVTGDRRNVFATAAI